MFENLAHHPELDHLRAENRHYADVDRDPDSAEIIVFDVVQVAADGRELGRDTVNSYDLVGYALSPSNLDTALWSLNIRIRARTVRSHAP